MLLPLDLIFGVDCLIVSRFARDEVDEMCGQDSCELIWEKGVGFPQTPVQVSQHHLLLSSGCHFSINDASHPMLVQSIISKLVPTIE